MPLYEYRCKGCGQTIEVIQSFSDPLLTVCDRCGGELAKLMSSPAVQFKGSGWYVSDYGKGGSGPRKKEAGEGSSETKSESKGDAKSDGKSEPKTESKSETKSESKTETKESKPESKKPDAA